MTRTFRDNQTGNIIEVKFDNNEGFVEEIYLKNTDNIMREIDDSVRELIMKNINYIHAGFFLPPRLSWVY